VKRFIFLLFAAFLLCLQLGCQSGPLVKLPSVPAYQAPSIARTYTSTDVVIACGKLAPAVTLELSDTKFVALSHEWLEQAVAWSLAFGRATGLDRFESESWDCDKFAMAFALAANVAAQRAGVKAQPLLARIHVIQIAPFGRVSAGGAHALNGFLSDRAPYLWVLEPQTRTLVPLESYPNRETIFKIKIGG
jgi:hypothetical protein